MKILVTGGLGYIGSHTVVELVSSGYDVTIVDNLSNSNKNVLANICKILNISNIEFFEIDLKDYNSFEKILGTRNFDCVIHFAALKSIPESNNKPIEYYENNISGSLNLLKFMKKSCIKNIIFSSTASIYGTQNISPFKESYALNANNPYSKSKLFTEEIIKSAFLSQDIDMAINLRYFNPVGAHPTYLIGENPLDTPTNIMPVICRVAKGIQEYLEIYGSDYDTRDGTGERDYIHIQDLAIGHVKALEFILSKSKSRYLEYINLGTGEGHTVIELKEKFEKVNGLTIPFKFKNRRHGDIASAFSDPSYAEKLIKWKSKKTLEDMCRDSWNWSKL
jgi:UDP-glucose 4-epimerase